MKKLISLCLFITLIFSVAAVESGKYIPAECNTLMGFNIEKITTIPALKDVLKDPSIKVLKKMCSYGLNPEETSSILIGMNSQAILSTDAFEEGPEVIMVKGHLLINDCKN